MAIRDLVKDDEKMKKIVIDYNPYYLDTRVLFENIPTQRLTKTLQILELKNKEKKAFQLWIDKFLETFFTELNTDKICIEFKGRLSDYEDVKTILEDYPKCELNFYEKYEDKNFKDNLLKRMDELEKIKEEFNLNIDTSKYPELFRDEIKIAVMAPMSSGKSTFINALLGNDILPAENIACTSKIFEIVNNKHLSKGEYKARLVLNSQPISEWKKVERETLDNLQKTMDDGENINTKIELTGNFSFLSNENYNIKLIDTPGPNNDNNSDHRQESFNFIKNEKDCIILYVLDSTSLTTKDSGEYISEIARFLNENENEKELSDKIIFILNKFDCASVSRGEDKRIYEDALMFLKNKGIKNPNIFPISSFFIKSLRKGLKNIDEETMTEEEEEEYDEFKKIQKKFTRYNLNTLNFTPLPESLKKKFNDEKDELKKLENLGGITAIEYYIKRHISRYYLVYKMNFALTKVLGDIKRELSMISLSFDNRNNIIEVRHVS
ncbi:MAG: dynamin family protein [Fusobacteriaceae bacterium]